MSGSITSSGNSPNRASGDVGPWFPVYRAALEGAVVVGVLGGAAHPFVAPWAREDLWLGLGLAWLAGTSGTAGLAWGQAKSPAWFWRAYGLGAALRVGVLAGIVAKRWDEPWQQAGALMGSYAVGLTAVILLEFRHLVQIKRHPSGARRVL